MNVEEFGMHPTSYTREIDLDISDGMSSDEVRDKVVQILYEITANLKECGCKLVGHIKALLDSGTGCALFFSITDFDKSVKYKGNIINTISDTKLIINIIVFGVNVKDIEKIVNNALNKSGIDM